MVYVCFYSTRITETPYRVIYISNIDLHPLQIQFESRTDWICIWTWNFQRRKLSSDVTGHTHIHTHERMATTYSPSCESGRYSQHITLCRRCGLHQSTTANRAKQTFEVLSRLSLRRFNFIFQNCIIWNHKIPAVFFIANIELLQRSFSEENRQRWVGTDQFWEVVNVP